MLKVSCYEAGKRRVKALATYDAVRSSAEPTTRSVNHGSFMLFALSWLLRISG